MGAEAFVRRTVGVGGMSRHIGATTTQQRRGAAQAEAAATATPSVGPSNDDRTTSHAMPGADATASDGAAASADPSPVLRSSAPVYLEFRHVSVQLKTRGLKRAKVPLPLQLHRPAPVLGGEAVEYPPPPADDRTDPPPPLRSLQLSGALPSPPLFSDCRPQPTLSEKHGPIVRDAQSAPGVRRGWADLPPRRKHSARQREGFTPASEDDGSRDGATPAAPSSPFGSPPVALSSASSAAAAAFSPAVPAPSWPRPRSLDLQPQDAGKRFILKDVSGYAMPGQITAIMGASGAGTPQAQRTSEQWTALCVCASRRGCLWAASVC